MKTSHHITLSPSQMTPYALASLDMTVQAVNGGVAVHLGGIDSTKVVTKEVRKYFADKGFRELLLGTDYIEVAKGTIHVKWSYHSSDFTMVGSDEEEIRVLTQDLKERFGKQDKPRNSIYVLNELNESYALERLSLAGSEDLIEDNYSPKVVRAFHHLRTEMFSERPHGRIGILTGHPGTGKTYLARALMGPYVANADFILVNPEEVQQLARNAPKFLRLRAKRPDKIPVLILEDADQALQPRKDDTVSIIQKILNFGDGILGDAYNVRILLTSNVRTPEIDPAILRPGRLIAHIEVGPLSTVLAQEVYQRLTGRERTYVRPVTLATVYQDSVQDRMEVAAE